MNGIQTLTQQQPYTLGAGQGAYFIWCGAHGQYDYLGEAIKVGNNAAGITVTEVTQGSPSAFPDNAFPASWQPPYSSVQGCGNSMVNYCASVHLLGPTPGASPGQAVRFYSKNCSAGTDCDFYAEVWLTGSNS